MNIKKSIKTIAGILLLTAVLGGIYAAGQTCSATNTCESTCYAHPPAGGYVVCTSGAWIIQCCSYYADGSINYCVTDRCRPDCI